MIETRGSPAASLQSHRVADEDHIRGEPEHMRAAGQVQHGRVVAKVGIRHVTSDGGDGGAHAVLQGELLMWMAAQYQSLEQRFVQVEALQSPRTCIRITLGAAL